MAIIKALPVEVVRLRHEANSNDPIIAESARKALSAMGKKGGRASAVKRRQQKLELDARAEAYRRASRGE